MTYNRVLILLYAKSGIFNSFAQQIVTLITPYHIDVQSFLVINRIKERNTPCLAYLHTFRRTERWLI
jgi:hypothetical protein